MTEKAWGGKCYGTNRISPASETRIPFGEREFPTQERHSERGQGNDGVKLLWSRVAQFPMYTLGLSTPEKMCSCGFGNVWSGCWDRKSPSHITHTEDFSRVQRGSGRAWASSSINKALPHATHVKGVSPVGPGVLHQVAAYTREILFGAGRLLFFFETQKVQTLVCQPRSVVIAREQTV